MLVLFLPTALAVSVSHMATETSSLAARLKERAMQRARVEATLSLDMVESGMMSVDEFGRRWSQRWHAALPSQYPYTAPIEEDEDLPALLQEEMGVGAEPKNHSQADEPAAASQAQAKAKMLEHHVEHPSSKPAVQHVEHNDKPAAAPKAAAPAQDHHEFDHDFSKEFALSKANAKKQLIVTFVNAHYVDFAANWVTHLRALNVTNYIVGAMDRKAHEMLGKMGIPTFNMDSGLTQGDYGWGSKNFKIMGQHKFQFLLNLLRYGIDTFMTDADTVLLRDPFQFISKFPDVDVLVSSDHLANTVNTDTELETTGAAHSAMNIGLMYLKHTAVDLVHELQENIVTNPNAWDQDVFGQLMRRGWTVSANSHTFTAYNGKLTGGILPVSVFASGHTGFVQKMAQKLNLQPYGYHATFQYSGTNGKRHRMREFMVFNDAPEYYNPKDQNFLTYTPRIPEELKKPKGTKWTVEEHFALANHQLKQIRNAWAAAVMLNRILILPALVCGMDRWWAPHTGTIPGALTTLPVENCPADHMLDLGRGLNLDRIREYSFLDNPRTPDEVKKSVVTRELAGSVEALHQISKNSSLSGVRLLRLESMPDAFAPGLLSAQAQDALKSELTHWGDLWCCVHPPGGKGAGHIWYDLLFDRVHKDRFQRQWTNESMWFPKLGP